MKKLFVVLLSLALIFAFAACGQTEAPAEEAPVEEAAVNGEIIGTLNQNGITEEEFSEVMGDTIRFYDDLTSLQLALEKGDISCIATTKLFFDYLDAANPGVYQMEEDKGTSLFSMATLTGNKELLDRLDNALYALKDNGTLAALEKQYITDCDPANMPAPAELPRIEGADTVRVVLTGDRPPMDYMNAEGKAAGYNIALLSAIADQAQINFELVSANSASRALMLTSGKADLVFWCASYQIGDKINKNDMTDGLILTATYLESPGVRIRLAQ